MQDNNLIHIPDDIELAPNEPNCDNPPIIKVIGVGGGGNNAINYMYRQGIKNVSFVVCNTDAAALRNSPVENKVLIGSGLGAGNKPEVAREAAEEHADRIKAIFDEHTEMVFITAGMGGGTGTGAGPVVARLAKEAGLLTIGIVTIPFLFEGKQKIIKALDGADEMAKHVDALLVINNERLTEIYHDLDFINAFGKADDTLATAAGSISEIINCDGYINLDFNDVDTTLRNGGAAIISTGYGEGDMRVTKAIEDALKSPLLKNRDILGSKRLLFNIYFSRQAENPFKMAEAEELNTFISTLDPAVDIIWGVAFDDTLGDAVKITILAAGLDVELRKDPVTPPRRPQIPPVATTPRTAADRNPSGENLRTMHQPHQGGVTPQSREVKSAAPEERIAKEYGAGKIDQIQGIIDAARYVILAPNQFDNDDVIEMLERTPAYNREKRVSDEIKSSGRPSSQQQDYDQYSNGGSIEIKFDDDL